MRPLQLANVDSSMNCKAFGRVRDVSSVQKLNAFLHVVVKDFGNVTAVNPDKFQSVREFQDGKSCPSVEHKLADPC